MISVTFLFGIDTIESDAFDASSNRGLIRGQVPDCWDQALLLDFLPHRVNAILFMCFWQVFAVS